MTLVSAKEEADGEDEDPAAAGSETTTSLSIAARARCLCSCTYHSISLKGGARFALLLPGVPGEGGAFSIAWR